MIQTEKGGVFAQGGKTLVRRIGAVRLHTEPVGQLGEEVVAGVLYAFLDVLAVMASGPDPALDGLGNLIVYTGTLDGVLKSYHALFQGCHSRDGLKGGTGGLLGLRGVVVKGSGHVVLELAEVSRVHAARHQVIVIAGICDQGSDFACFYVRHHHSCRTRVKSQLRRRQLQVGYLFLDKLVGVGGIPHLEGGYGLGVICQYALGIKGQTELTACYDLIVNQVTEHALCKFVVAAQGFDDMVHQLGEYIVCIGVFTGHVQTGGVHPVSRDSAVNIVPQADSAIPPRLVFRRGLVNLILLYDPHGPVRQISIDIIHIGSHVLGKIVHGQGMGAEKLVAYRPEYLLPGCLVFAVNLFFNVGRPFLGHIHQGQHIVVNQLVIGVLYRNGYFGRVISLVGVQIIVLEMVADDTGQLLLYQLVNSNLQIPVNGQVHIIPGLGVRLFNDFTGTPHVVHIHPGVALFSLKLQLHGFLDSDTAHNIVEIVLVRGVFRQAGRLIGLVPLLVQGGQLILLNLACIADDRGKIDAVLILAHIGLLHRNAL